MALPLLELVLMQLASIKAKKIKMIMNQNKMNPNLTLKTKKNMVLRKKVLL